MERYHPINIGIYQIIQYWLDLSHQHCVPYSAVISILIVPMLVGCTCCVDGITFRINFFVLFWLSYICINFICLFMSEISIYIFTDFEIFILSLHQVVSALPCLTIFYRITMFNGCSEPRIVWYYVAMPPTLYLGWSVLAVMLSTQSIHTSIHRAFFLLRHIHAINLSSLHSDCMLVDSLLA